MIWETGAGEDSAEPSRQAQVCDTGGTVVGGGKLRDAGTPLVADLNQADGIIGDCDLDILIVEFPQAGREAVVEAVVGGHRQEAGWGGAVITGKLLRVGGMRRCYSPTYTPLGYISRVAMLLSSIYPLGVYFQGVEGTALMRGWAWSPSSLLTVGRGWWEAGGGKHRSATGPGGGGGESAAAGLAQCLGDDQIDTGPTVVPTAGAPW